MKHKVKCYKCNSMFLYENLEWGVPGGKEREYIHCPYCNAINGSEITNGWIFTYKL
jgi:hypothetical protein